MYQWREFEFLEEKYAGKCSIPDEVAGKIECCSSGRGKIAVGCDDGTVSLLDRGLKFNFGFQAHSSSVLFLQQLKITTFLILEEAPPPILLIAIGLDNGCIYCIQVNNQADKSQSSITGMGFCIDGQTLQLFAVTPTSISLFNLQTQPAIRHTLDQIGCSVNSIGMNDCSELIVGRPEAVYFYEVDGRGPCWAFEGEKKFVGWFRGYLLCVVADQRNSNNTFNIYDLKNRLIAHSVVVKEVSHMLCEWGSIVLIMDDKSAQCIGEKDMESKLDMLINM